MCLVKRVLSVGLVLLFASNLNANFYLGAGFESALQNGIVAKRTEQDQSTRNWYIMPNTVLITGFAGYGLTKFLDIQVSADFSLPTNRIGVSSHNNNEIFSKDSSYRTFFAEIKPKYPVKDNGFIFLIAGVGKLDGKNSYYLDESSKDKLLSDNYSSLAYKLGLGYEFIFNNKHSLVFDYAYTVLADVKSDNNYYLIEDNAKEVEFENKQALSFKYKYSFK